MTRGDLPVFDEPESWHWYVLLGYPVVSLLGILSLARLTDGGSILASSVGSVALLIVVTAVGALTLPAIWRDVEFVTARTDAWEPDRQLYVGAAVAAPIVLGVLSGLAAGFAVAVALAILAFLLSTIAASVAYLYNRHQSIGLLVR